MTPNDNREMERPPKMRSGPQFDAMLETFDRSAAAGADLLSIESVGGKEVHDDALLMADIQSVIFSLCIMGARDMAFLWDHIVDIANRHNVVAAGDTACGFGNTAMVLAEQNLIPRVFAAIVRPITAVRSLVAYERGALGPGKDCGYENPILKTITGYPMSMEGKSAACAHLSPVGNIAAASCDLWSNESVQDVMLLGGMAPTCCLESLEYDCRLFNRALSEGSDSASTLQRWLVDSDAKLDPQAYVLTPENSLAFAEEIVSSETHYEAGKRVAARAVAILREGIDSDSVNIPERDRMFLDMVDSTLQGMADDEDTFIGDVLPLLDSSKFIAEDYDLA
jgi:methanol--5-hydroxybenzimidazolylcobamide Co-methyltransferase